jgi:hypothetical protein
MGEWRYVSTILDLGVVNFATTFQECNIHKYTSVSLAGWKCIDWNHLAQERIEGPAVVNMVMNVPIPQQPGRWSYYCTK